MIALRRRSLGVRSGAVRRARKGRLGPGPDAPPRLVWLPSDIVVALRSLWGGLGMSLRSSLGVGGARWEAALVALCGTRGGDLRSRLFRALPPPGLQVPAEVFGLGRFLKDFLKQRCPLDSEFELNCK